MELDVEALVDYVNDVRRASRVGSEPAAEDGSAEVDADRVRWRRLAATHAASRLPAGRHAEAARSGLQDSEPRAALVALHARPADVDPSGWDHPDLAQVWLRWADYVVPRDDVAVFTLGPRPRDRRYRDAVDALADLVVAATDGGRRDSSAVMRELTSDLDALLAAERPSGVRLLPAGDPCLSPREDQPPAPEPLGPDEANRITTRVLNSLTGRVVVDGEVVGAWGRAKGKVTIDPWPALPDDRADDVAAEAESLARPIGARIDVRWLTPTVTDN